jgi:hypothetical protein
MPAQRDSKLAPSAMGSDTKRRCRTSENVGGLLGCEAFPRRQQQSLPVSVTQRRERLGKLQVWQFECGDGSWRGCRQSLYQPGSAPFGSLLMPEHAPATSKQPRQRVCWDVIKAAPSHEEHLADNVGGGLRISPPLRVAHESAGMFGIQRLESGTAISFVHTTPCPATAQTLRATWSRTQSALEHYCACEPRDPRKAGISVRDSRHLRLNECGAGAPRLVG